MTRTKNLNPVIVDAGPDGWLIWTQELADVTHHFSSESTVKDQNDNLVVAGHQRGWMISIAADIPTSLWWTIKRSVRGEMATLGNLALHAADPDRFPLSVAVADMYDDDGGFTRYSTDDYEIETTVTVETKTVDLTAATIIPGDWDLPDLDWLKLWEPGLIPAITKQPELGAFFPGKLSGFRAHMATLVAQRAEVYDVYCKGHKPSHGPISGYEPTGGPSFTVRMPWSDGRTVTQRVSKRSKKTETNATWASVKVPLSDVPLSIPGDNMQDAVEEWEAAEARWLATWDLIGAKSCATCEGKGWIRAD